ncbi:MAG: xanthine dehydrogenase family protein subunit M [Xanthobacteraceae bacterium]|jgi:carbon-monoxide dehydrogenase medium subunit
MKAFAYHRPTSVADAAALLGNGPESRPIAGGMTLLPTIKQRLAAPSALIDLSAIPGLAGIAVSADGLTVGAMTRHVDVARSEVVAKAIPALAGLAAGIGDPAVRNRGTIGGSLANNDPAADYPAAVLALGATVVTSAREIPAEDFFLGMFETALRPGEVITAVKLPQPSMAGYAKFANPASRFALVGVFVAKFATGVRVAVTGAGPSVFRLDAFEGPLSDRFQPDAVDRLTVDPTGLNSDIHAEAAFRAHLVKVMAKRAVAAALQN